MWWPNLLDIDGVGQDDGKNMHTSSDNPSSNLIQSNEDFPALPSLKRDPRADNNINNINMHARGIPHQRNLVDTKADLNGVAAQISGPSKLLRSSFMHKVHSKTIQHVCVRVCVCVCVCARARACVCVCVCACVRVPQVR